VPPRDKLSKEAYMQDSHRATTINHFYEKLLKIKVGPWGAQQGC
jgi:hypothetical protein